jgi:CO/xanthine dehydrogenase Mo-binding subunit
MGFRQRDGRVRSASRVSSLDMPKIEVDIVDSYDPTGSFGAKGVGDPTCVSTAAAILNAIHNAVGVRITSLPATAGKVFAAIKAKRAQEQKLLTAS